MTKYGLFAASVLLLSACAPQEGEPPVENAAAVDCAVDSTENNSAAVCVDDNTVRENEAIAEEAAEANAS